MEYDKFKEDYVELLFLLDEDEMVLFIYFVVVLSESDLLEVVVLSGLLVN